MHSKTCSVCFARLITIVKRTYVPIVTIVLILTVGSWLDKHASRAEQRVSAANKVIRSPRDLGEIPGGNLSGAEQDLTAAVLDWDHRPDGHHIELVYFGNSQAQFIVSPGPGDLTSAQYLQLLLTRKPLPGAEPYEVRLASLPGMNISEMCVMMMRFGEQNPRAIDVAIAPIYPEQVRTISVRNTLTTSLLFARDSVIAFLRENQDLTLAQNALLPILKSSSDNLQTPQAQKSDIDGASHVQSLVQAYASKWPLYAHRELFEGVVESKLIYFRNFLFGIHTWQARPVPAERFDTSIQMTELLARYARARGIKLVFYLAPVRNSTPNPYSTTFRAELKRDVWSICRTFSLVCVDYSELVPDSLYGISIDTPGDPDFAHMVAEGHKMIALRLMSDLEPQLTRWAAQ